MNRAYRIRISIASIFALLVLLVIIQPSHSQIRPGGGIRGTPGPIGPPGGVGIRGGAIGSPTNPGMPGAGISGGFSGISGRPPGFPDIPGPPDFPRPPGIGGRPGIGGGIPGGPAIYDWSCSGCGRHLGTGPTPPLTRICPGCGARLEGSQIIDGPGVPGPGRGGVPAPITPPAFPPAPVAPPIGPPVVGPGAEIGGPMAPPFNGGVYVPPSTTPSSSTSSSSGGSSRSMVLLITLGALLLLGIGIGAIVFTIVKSSQSSKPKRRSRPHRRSRYDNDDDY